MKSYTAFRIHRNAQEDSAALANPSRPELYESEMPIRVSHPGVNDKDAFTGDWRPPQLDDILSTTEILDILPQAPERLLVDKSHGRAPVELGDA